MERLTFDGNFCDIAQCSLDDLLRAAYVEVRGNE